jgi:hypothetical protein
MYKHEDKIMKIKSLALLFSLVFASFGLSASELAGLWKHSEKPVWVEISFDGSVATGTVLRNDNKPDAVGATFLRDVQGEDIKAGPWAGEVYAAPLGEFKDATISLGDADDMEITVKLGFMSRSVSWSRVDSVPTE